MIKWPQILSIACGTRILCYIYRILVTFDEAGRSERFVVVGGFRSQDPRQTLPRVGAEAGARHISIPTMRSEREDRIMNKMIVSMLAILAIGLTGNGYLMAEGDLTAQKPIEMKVQLGDGGNAKWFFPANLEFATGRLYRLVLHNASKEKHYFSSEGLSRSVFTRKAQVLGPEGETIAEIKGFIREIEVYPNGTAEWWFVPVKTAVLDDLKCTIKGHSEAGMVGRITIK